VWGLHSDRVAVYSGGDVAGIDPRVSTDICRAVNEALSRFGAVGQVSVHDDRVVLESPSGRYSTSLGLCARDWERLSPSDRQRAGIELARRLNDQRRTAPPRQLRPPRVGPYVVTGLLLAVLVAILVAYPFVTRPRDGAAPGPDSEASSPRSAQDERTRQACEQSRARVLRGGTLGPLDVDGWVVEVALLRPGTTLELLHDPGLAAFVERDPQGARLVWTGSPELSQLTGPTTRFSVSERKYPTQGDPLWRELILTFSGRFVDRYFREEQRPAFFELADALTRRLGGTHGAVYARCAHRQDAMVGSWIRGGSVPAATAAVLFFMDVRSASSHVRSSPPRAGELASPVGILGRLEAAAASLDRRQLATLLADTGGMVAGSRDGPVTVVFPFKDFSRASRAGIQLARHLDVGQ